MMQLSNLGVGRMSRLGAVLGLCVLGAFASPARAQVLEDIQTTGTAYFIYASPTDPTFEVVVVGEGTRSGIYRLREGTTLTELLGLSGGTPTSSETEREIVEAFVRVLRSSGGEQRTVIYEATTEQAIREPQRHPVLQSGDVIETDVTYEVVDEPFTVLSALELAARIASLASVAILLFVRSRNL